MIRLLSVVFIFVPLISSLPHSGAHARNLFSPNIANEGIHINIGGGWGFFQPDDINEQNDLIANEKIDDGLDLQLGVSKFISPRISTGLGLHYIKSGIDYESIGQYIDMNYSALLQIVVAELQVKYYFPLAHVDYFLGGSQMVCFADYRNNGNYLNQGLPPLSLNWDNKYHGVGIGFSTAAGIRKEFSRTVGMHIEVGYRYLATGSLNGETTSPYASPDYLRPVLDLSGPFTNIGFSFMVK